MHVAAPRSSPGILATVAVVALSVALMAPGVGTVALAQPAPTPAVAGIQMLSLPMQAWLGSGMTLNGIPFSAGQAIFIVGVPSGFNLPLQGGSVLLPAGSIITVAGRPELGQITLSSGGVVNIGFAPPVGAPAQLTAPVGATLATGLNVGSLQLPAGTQIFITGLPQGVILPQQPSIFTLPPGSWITIPNRPDVGQITLTVAVSVDLTPHLPMGPAVSLASPMAGILTVSANIGAGLLLPAGTQVLVTGLPQGFVLPQQPGIITVPPGTTLMVPTRVDLGSITLSAPTSIDFSGSAMLPGMGPIAGRATLLTSLSFGGTQFLVGEPLDILSLPAGFILPLDGAITLPAGTVIGFPGRPDLGPITLSGPIGVDMVLGGGITGAPPMPPAAMLPVPMSGTLAAGLTLGNVQLGSGTRIEILGVPPGFNLAQSGTVTLPPGTVVRFPDRPDLGPVTLTQPARAEIGVAMPAPPIPAPPVVEPPAVVVPLEPDLTPFEPGLMPMPVWPDLVMLSTPVGAWLADTLWWGDMEFSAGEPVLIIGLRFDMMLEPGGAELPAGTVIILSNWPELGEIELEEGAVVEVAAENWMR